LKGSEVVGAKRIRRSAKYPPRRAPRHRTRILAIDHEFALLIHA
jgi:hypothetical protein